jgi:radical SAM protein with 4Fe4S-binding SPASM domain
MPSRNLPRSLRTVVIETTLRCDHACIFCGSRAGPRAPDEMSTADIIRAITEAASLGARQIELTGGETYLREDWLELVGAATRLGLECSLVTAGRAIDSERAAQAKQAGLARVGVSIDGPAEIHDRLRGVRGSFDQARRAIDAFRTAGIPVGCNTQVNAHNLRALPALGDILVGEGLYAWQIQLLIPMGRATDDRSLWLEPYQMLEAVPLIADVIERSDRRGLVVYAGDNVGYFGPHEQTLRRFGTKLGHTIGCTAGVVGLGIDPAGNVKGCSALDGPEFVAGNVKSDHLADLWETSPRLRMIEDGSADDLWGFCATCYYASVCRGGCSVTAYALTGRRGNNPYCHHRALELAKKGLRERLVPKAGVDRGRGYVAFEVVTETAQSQGSAAMT